MSVSTGCRERGAQVILACRAARSVIFAVWVAVMMTVSCGSPPDENGREGLQAALPVEVAGWRAVDGGEVYDAESIFGYIDGHAEVYLAYGMQRCLARRYAGPAGEADIVIDLFELSSPVDAYGVFTHDRDGEEVDVAQGALLRRSWLSFWKGRWFGSVYAEGESERSHEAVLALGRAAAAVIHEEGQPPSLVGDLPVDGLERRSVRFLHTHEILNSALFIGFENVLRLGVGTDAALGQYRRDGGEAWLVLVDYPGEEAARKAELSAKGAGFASLRMGARLAAVLATDSPELGEALLGEVMGAKL